MIPFAAALVFGWSLTEFLVAVVVIAACVGIALIALKAFGIPVPPWVVQIFWICVVALVAIAAIRFVAGL